MKFMESGHSYLEADSMHSTIERAKKHKKIYTTQEWSLLLQTARQKLRPYNVKRGTGPMCDLHIHFRPSDRHTYRY